MTKSRKQRIQRVYRVIPTEEMGPNFISNLKHGIIQRYEYHLKALDEGFKEIHSSIGRKPEKSILHSQISRFHLIECLTTFDSSVNNVLHQHQIRNLDKRGNEIQEFSKVEDGLNKVLKDKEIPKELDNRNSNMKHYRALRNQFGHYPYGFFFFSANHESFENFLLRLSGIETGRSEHIIMDGKAGVYLPYQINSNHYIYDFYKLSIEYLNILTDFLFPTT